MPDATILISIRLPTVYGNIAFSFNVQIGTQMKKLHFTLILLGISSHYVFADTLDYKAKFNSLYGKLQLQQNKIQANHSYEFSPDDVQAMANRVSQDTKNGIDVYSAFQNEFNAIKQQHGNKIADTIHWRFNEAGNVIGEISLVYASMNEYLAFFGTPVGTTGFSGRYPYVEIWDCPVSGRMADWVPGRFAETYNPGQCEDLQKGQAKGFTMEPMYNASSGKYSGSFTIEYARGNIVTSMPFGIYAPLHLTRDYKTAFEILTDFSKLVLKSKS